MTLQEMETKGLKGEKQNTQCFCLCPLGAECQVTGSQSVPSSALGFSLPQRDAQHLPPCPHPNPAPKDRYYDLCGVRGPDRKV